MGASVGAASHHSRPHTTLALWTPRSPARPASCPWPRRSHRAWRSTAPALTRPPRPQSPSISPPSPPQPQPHPPVPPPVMVLLFSQSPSSIVVIVLVLRGECLRAHDLEGAGGLCPHAEHDGRTKVDAQLVLACAHHAAAGESSAAAGWQHLPSHESQQVQLAAHPCEPRERAAAGGLRHQ